MRRLAESFLSYAVALHVAHRLRLAAGNADLMPSECHGVNEARLAELFDEQRSSEINRITVALSPQAVQKIVHDEFTRLADFLARDANEWQQKIPGKPIFKKFATKTPIDPATLKRLYIKAAATVKPDPFQDIRDIFRQFATFSYAPHLT
jgi:hypothetical protein